MNQHKWKKNERGTHINDATYAAATFSTLKQCSWSFNNFNIGTLSIPYYDTTSKAAIVRLGASDGTPVWGVGLRCQDSTRFKELNIDPVSGDIYGTGYVEGNATLYSAATSTSVTSAVPFTNADNAVFVKISAAGTPVFIKAFYAVDSNAILADTEALAISVDSVTKSAWIVGGYYPGTLNFAGETLDVSNAGPNSYTIFIVRYGLDGTEQWATNFLSEGPAYAGNG